MKKQIITETYSYIYLITNQINNKQYIGQHTTKNLLDGYSGSGKLLKHAYKKYGMEHFIFEILEFIETKYELDLAEQKYISLFQTMIPSGYNIQAGGTFTEMNEITKNKLSQTNKQNKHIYNPLTGERRFIPISSESELPDGFIFGRNLSTKFSHETKQKISQSNKNRRWIKNIKTVELKRISNDEPLPENFEEGYGQLTENQKEKRTQSLIGKNKNKKHSLEQNKNHSERMKNRKHIYNPLTGEALLIDIDNELPEGFVYGRIITEEWRKNNSEAQKKAYKPRKHIRNPLTGERKFILVEEDIPDGWVLGCGPK